MGPLLLKSLIAQDMFLAGTIILLLGVLTVIGTFISDLILMWVDPASAIRWIEAMKLAHFFGFGRTAEIGSAEDRLAQASQLKLTWWRFRRHKLAVASAVIVILFYLVAVFADFLAYSDPHDTDSRRSYIPPQAINFIDDGAFRPYIYGLKGTRDMRTFRISYQPDLSRKVYLRFFAEGYSYRLLGLIPTNRHLIGLVDPRPEDNLFILGSDLLGRDLWSG